MRRDFLESLALAAARVAGVAFVLIATLRSGGSELPAGWTRCLACGDLAAAEVVQNLLLFVPFGLAWGLGARRAGRVVLAGFLLSLAVEVVQHRLPGRDPSLADVVFNTIGTAGGVGLALAAPALLAPPDAWLPWLGLGAALAVAAVLGATGFLLRPTTDHPRLAVWVPDLPRLPRYKGHVVRAALGPTPLVPGAVTEPARWWTRWNDGEPLDVTFVLGPPPGAFAPIVAVLTARAERLLVLGAAGTDLALWPRTRAAAWRLDEPDLRFRDALRGLEPGDTLTVTVSRRAHTYCLALGDERRCGLGYDATQGWALVLYPESFPPWLQRVGGLAWLAAWAWPLGVWWRRHPVSWGALVVLGTAVAVIPVATGLRPSGPLEGMAALGGIAAGVLLRRPAYAIVTRITRRRG